MAAQQAVDIINTVASMKRAMARRNDASDSDESITQPTNRGNKLKRNARYVSEGHLDLPNGPRVYKRKVDHAGYTRSIIARNPRRYDEYGDPLEAEEIDAYADAIAASENPYGDIKLEYLLRPLTSAEELPTHPSLSLAYTSTALSKMTEQAAEMLRKERATLWRTKHLLTKFRDATWVPCGVLETKDDIMLFGPLPNPESPSMQRLASMEDTTGVSTGSRTQEMALKRIPDQVETSLESAHIDEDMEEPLDGRAPTADGENGDAEPTRSPEQSPVITKERALKGTTKEANTDSVEPSDTAGGALFPTIDPPQTDQTEDRTTRVISDEILHKLTDEPMPDAPIESNGTASTEAPDATSSAPTSLAPESAVDDSAAVTLTNGLGPSTKPNDTDTAGPFRAVDNPEPATDGPATDGKFTKDDASDSATAAAMEEPGDSTPKITTDATLEPELASTEHPIVEADPHPTPTPSPSPPAAHRMTTRARLAPPAIPSQRSPTPPQGPMTYQIHPLFIPPASSLPDANFGLPPLEAEETRRLLLSYVQKQEEVCRGAERFYEGLLRAERMRRNVWEWTRQEAHVGEMSDGEDWVDGERWGLLDGREREEKEKEGSGRGRLVQRDGAAGLKKGMEEDEGEEQSGGKRTRGRRGV